MYYERAAFNALTQNFPNAEIQGCFFHFGQEIWRHIQALGLQQRYQNDEEFAIILKEFRVLAFVPAIDVIPCYEELVESLSDELIDDLNDFLSYFERTWIGIEHYGRRRRPLFSIELWNVIMERWHRGFDIRINSTHPSVSKLNHKILIEQSKNLEVVTN